MKKIIPFLCLLLFVFIAFAQEQKAPEQKPQPQQKVGLDPKEIAKAESIAKKYFEAKSEDEKKKILDEITEIDHPSKGDIDKITKLCLQLAKKGSKHDGKSPSTLKHPDYPGKYYFDSQPPSKKVGLLIGLHGGGEGDGDGRNLIQIYRGAYQGFDWIAVFPEVIKKEMTAWNKEREERFVMELIEELKRTYNIDTNRIYLTGHSMGGFGTWSIGGHYADVFAAINPNSGGIFGIQSPDGQITRVQSGVLANLKNTPVYFFHADGDGQVSVTTDRIAAKVLKEFKDKYGPYDYVYEEIKANHHAPPANMKAVFDWMWKRKRDPYPKLVIWEPFREYKKYFCWLKMDNPSQGQRVVAKIEGNKVTLEGSTGGLTVFLNDKMVNLTKPIIVEVDGKEKFNGMVNYSLAVLIETIEAKKDPERYFTAKIKAE